MDCFYSIHRPCSLLCALFGLSLIAVQQIHALQRLRLGHSLTPERNQTVLQSPDGTFSAGFYAVGINAYGFAIWYSQTPSPYTVVWMANRNKPVNGKHSRLRLQRDGDFVLLDADGSAVWTTNTKDIGVKEAKLLPVGNLILLGSSGQIIWQSFDSPTDTLLPQQLFTKKTQLISRVGSDNYRSGYYRFYFNDDSYLSLIYEGLNISSKYWPDPEKLPIDNGRSIYNITRVAVLDGSGGFRSSDNFSFNAWDYGEGPLRRLTLDADGNMRLYSLNLPNQSWKISWIAMLQQCSIHGLCGPYGMCTYTPEPICVCPPGFERVDLNDWFKGCRPIKELSCGANSSQIIKLPFADYYGYDYFKRDGLSVRECEKLCMDECNCLGFSYRGNGTNSCYPKFLLISGSQTIMARNDMYIKISTDESSATNVSSVLQLLQSDSGSPQCSPQLESTLVQPQNNSSTVGKKGRTSQVTVALVSFVAALGLTEIVSIALGRWLFIKAFDEADIYNRQGYFAIAGVLKRFEFSELRKATDNFSECVGKGRFGSVYKGLLLPENKVIAVKRLESVSQGEGEFRTELSLIGRVSHMNLVRMFGYCAEAKHRLLVYEYVENGSLDKYLFTQDSSRVLDWNTRFQIAVGTARGLAYLHEECLERVLHCDIKPENILLDEHFHAKVSDFGMAKLAGNGHGNKGLAFSTIRGTRGYLAPEWTMNLPITAKADAYSFGILLLELVSGQKASEFNMSGSNFVQWASDNVREERWRESMVDPKLRGRDVEWKSKMEIERVLKVALLCIEEDNRKRPFMSQVVEMLTPAVRGDVKEIEMAQIFRQTSEFSAYESTLSDASTSQTSPLLSSVDYGVSEFSSKQSKIMFVENNLFFYFQNITP
ncbi:hypothetical protein SUGI_0009750 [Cryptomeria japonica]|uniref:putative receptor protein kinase ZmPK1 n=1 Tax=Cryptomeria japonica TaxID=3369 RepID=UPI002408CED7|nr:putative receptor protein kinase ZmPK1 [Cryptomeria japonica]GLJ05030.1 hypothetical protein SUGI_0009750 [Cryptomeria japonica]